MSMNNFDKRIHELRLQYRDERIALNRECCRTIGHINNTIAQTKFPEVKAALRAEKVRVYRANDESMRWNRICYQQALEALVDEYAIYLEKHPSKRQLRRMAVAD